MHILKSSLIPGGLTCTKQWILGLDISLRNVFVMSDFIFENLRSKNFRYDEIFNRICHSAHDFARKVP